MKVIYRMGGCLTLGFLLALGGAGCQSGKDSSAADFASVQIQHRTTDQVREAAVAVFRERGYEVSMAAGGRMLFEKEGNAMSQLAYGGFITEQNVWVRVPATIVSLGPGNHRLECSASLVRNKGDSFFEEEVRLSRVRRKPFQEMLDEVAKRLQ